MSPRVAEPGARESLLETAARLLAEEGPAALTTRRVTAEAGTSTMGVYTHFGGKEQLVRAIVWEGFERLGRWLGEIRPTDDPVADLGQQAIAYRANATANPHLYAVMFGSSPVPEYRQSPEDAVHGYATFLMLVDAVQRCIDGGRFEDRGATEMAFQLWASAHGVVTLEQQGFLVTQTDDPLGPLCVTLGVGFGDDPAAAAASYRKAQRRRRPQG
ncbi:MAG: TetR/AcrR family transcriptional regulator [Ilumatobacteraceae bacterium]